MISAKEERLRESAERLIERRVFGYFLDQGLRNSGLPDNFSVVNYHPSEIPWEEYVARMRSEEVERHIRVGDILGDQGFIVCVERTVKEEQRLRARANEEVMKETVGSLPAGVLH